MFVIIVGGGRTGTELAKSLLAEGHQIKVIEERMPIVERLQEEVDDALIIRGEPSSPAILEEASIRQAQVLAAVTREDEANLVVTTLARFEFNVPRTIARVNNPKNAWLFTAEMGVDVSLNQTDILAGLIVEEMSMGDMMTLLKLRRGEFSLVEEKLLPGSRILSAPLRDLPLPRTCVIAAVIRQGKILAPRGDMLFEAQDELLAVVDNSSRHILQELCAVA